METWSVHQLLEEASLAHGVDTASSLQRYAQQLIGRRLPVVFTLGHLGRITDVSYRMLRETVNRRREAANYRMYAVKKRSGGRRFIHSVSSDLFAVQQFLNTEVLQACVPHQNSFAFHPTGGIRACAAMHCGAKWLFQFDIKDFFYSVSELDVFRIFRSLGYRRLLAFEMARLTTTTHLPKRLEHLIYHEVKLEEDSLPYPERPGYLGVLPQGAPSSPMLSNLAALGLDEALSKYAIEMGFVYTRYADDITISAVRLPGSINVNKIRRAVIGCIRTADFRENVKKTRIARPGSKKTVLGLLVDGEVPRLSKEIRNRIDRHLHASLKYGLKETAAHEGFDSAYGFFNHLSGLLAFVKDVDRLRWESFNERYKRIESSWLQLSSSTEDAGGSTGAVSGRENANPTLCSANPISNLLKTLFGGDRDTR